MTSCMKKGKKMSYMGAFKKGPPNNSQPLRKRPQPGAFLIFFTLSPFPATASPAGTPGSEYSPEQVNPDTEKARCTDAPPDDNFAQSRSPLACEWYLVR